MTRTVRIAFFDPQGRRELASAAVPCGTLVLDAAAQAGIEIASSCGRRGRCRSCRVRAIAGEIAPPTLQDVLQFGHDAVRERYRLSCRMPVIADCAVAAVPGHEETGHQILAGAADLDAGATPQSGIVKCSFRAEAPQDEHRPSSDVEQVLAHLAQNVSRDIPLNVYRALPAALRDAQGLVTLTRFGERVIDIESGDTSAHAYGVAIDIGTTTVVATLHSLATGEQIASAAAVNPQSALGGDLMSRIAFAQFDAKKLQVLRGRILALINDFIVSMTRGAAVAPAHIHKIVIAGNTCMHHVCLGIDTSYLGLAPYAPVLRDPIEIAGSDLPLAGAPNARICFLPIIAGFVGADTVAGILATRLHQDGGTRLLVDIGTNGEVVLAHQGRLLACSAPAGPAFEGGQLAHGMRGAEGAIERVTIDSEVACQVIGDVPALGICGSGLIDAVAAMCDAGALDPAGRLWRDGSGPLAGPLRSRIVVHGGARAFVLVDAAHSARGEAVLLTQSDIRQLQLAKAAVAGGVAMLQSVLGVREDQFDEVMLSGGFGNYLNIASAVRIGLLPDIALDRIRYVGNSALIGAQLALLSESERSAANDLARRVEHVALATHPEFQSRFVEACRLERTSRTRAVVDG